MWFPKARPLGALYLHFDVSENDMLFLFTRLAVSFQFKQLCVLNDHLVRTRCIPFVKVDSECKRASLNYEANYGKEN